MLQNVLFLLRFVCFYGIGISQIAAGLWLISRVLEKLILTAFVSVLIAFMEERISRGPYSAIFTDVTSLNSIF